jgi:hypothetical protein
VRLPCIQACTRGPSSSRVMPVSVAVVMAETLSVAVDVGLEYSRFRKCVKNVLFVFNGLLKILHARKWMWALVRALLIRSQYTCKKVNMYWKAYRLAQAHTRARMWSPSDYWMCQLIDSLRHNMWRDFDRGAVLC